MLIPDRATTWRLLLAGYWLTLFVATHVPRGYSGLPPTPTDKLVHTAAFAGLGFILAAAWESSVGRLTGRHLRIAWGGLMLYAAIDEVTQPLTGRSASVADWLADAAGAALGLLAFRVWQRMNEGR